MPGKIDPKVIEMMYKMFPPGSAHGQGPNAMPYIKQLKRIQMNKTLQMQKNSKICTYKVASLN